MSKPSPHHYYRNWLSLAGLIIAAGGLFAFLLLFAIDTFGSHSNPYMGILAYVVAPGFMFLGMFLGFLGIYLQRRNARRLGLTEAHSAITIDLSRPKDRRVLTAFVAGAAIFLLLTAIGSTQSYRYTESVTFCGQACHGPMKPEFVAYQSSAHARVSCVECHVGHGAKNYFQAKWNGVHQLLAITAGDYQKPIPTPIKNLRPARETCEQCHWPEKFVGNIDRTFHHFLSDESNSPFSIRMIVDVGGGDHPGRPAGGTHWHVSPSNRVEYIATDAQRQVIPWVRQVKPDGSVVEFRTADFKDDPSKHEIRTMDCIDCHNRPAHNYNSPNDEVDRALYTGLIDRGLPWVRSNAVHALVQEYATESEALQKIAAHLRSVYQGKPQLDVLVAQVQRIYTNNFFPEMKTDWRKFPDNRGHKEWAGCFRCHDGKHQTADGKTKIKASDCNSCHTILAQGAGDALAKLDAKGHNFYHIDAEYSDFDCNTCHTGAFPK
jgi:nitrate/TMAO reductase-like tetraheme cytochrome c subunit